MSFKSLTGAVLFCAALLPLCAFDIPLQREAPVLDGKLDDPCWTKLSWNEGFTTVGSKQPAKEPTRFKVFHDGSYLYLAVEAMESDMAHLRGKTYSRDSSLLWLNDSLEIGFTHDPACLQFRKCMIDCNGQICDLLCVDNNTASDIFNVFAEWKSNLSVKISRGEKSWIAEIALPFGCMDFKKGDKLDWRLNVARNRYAGSRKGELTSWAPVPRRQLPKTFPKVNMVSFDPKKYYFTFGKYTLDFVKAKSGKYELSAVMEVHNDTGSFKIVCTCLTENTSPVRRGKKRNKIGLGQFAELKVTIPDAVPGEHEVDFALYSSGKPVLLKQITRKETLQFKSVSSKLLRPAYRNNLYATMPDKTIEAVISLKEGIGSRLKVELAGEGTKTEKIIESASAENRVVFDGAKLKDGRYILRSTVTVNGQDVVDEVVIRKLPYQKGEVWLDSQGVTHVDGKKMLPFGWYGDYDGPAYPWVNHVLLMARFRSPEAAIKNLEKYRKKNLRVLLVPFQDLDPRGWVPAKIFSKEAMKKTVTKAQKEKIREFVSKVGKTDGLLGWYMADEPEGSDLNPNWYEEARNLIAEIDPYHPCILLNYGPDGIRKFYKGCDILMPDCYPQYCEDGSTSHPRWGSSEWAKTSTALRPAWQMPIGCLWPALRENKKGVPPDFRDQRSELFQALIHNVKGINFYAWYLSPKYSALIVGNPVNGKTLSMLKDYLLENSVPGGITVGVTPAVPEFQAGVKSLNGKLCVLAVNTSLKELKADFKLKKSFTGKLYPAGEHRSVDVQNGRFSDVFGPKDTHIYLTDSALAEAVPGVAETEKAIADHLKSRKKAGNLVGVGQMLDADYWYYGMGKLPKGVPDIQVSSERNFYATNGKGSSISFILNGSRYFMVDGLTEPERVEYSWAPVRSDKNPWMEFTLSEKAPVKEVRLYTPNGNLESCRITDDSGKAVTAENKGKNKVFSVSLPGNTTKKIRIEFLKYSYSDGKLGERLLTEVEIY